MFPFRPGKHGWPAGLVNLLALARHSLHDPESHRNVNGRDCTTPGSR